jgi:hypothetical protein
MANNTPVPIRIKRSVANSVVTGLANGELAFTANGNLLYIGDPAGTGDSIPIGGKYNYGVLTANQAIVVDEDSKIDAIIVANLQPEQIYANGSFGNASQALYSNGTGIYWGNVTNGTSVGGSNTQVQFNDEDTFGGDPAFTFDKDTETLSVTNISGNGASVTSVDAVSVGGNSASDLRTYANNTASDFAANAYSNAVSYADNTFATILNPTVSGTLTVNGNTVLGETSNDVVTFNASVNTHIIPNANVAHNIGENLSRWANIYAENIISTTGEFYGNVSVDGDLVVTGNVTAINVSSLSVTDPLIKLAVNNTISDTLYIGFGGQYNGLGNTTNHAGLVRDPTDKNFYLFSTYGDQESFDQNIIDVNDDSFSLANLNVYLLSGGLVTNSSVTNITANSEIAVHIVANTLVLSSPLAGNSGGTGKSSITNNALLIGNSSNGFNELTLGASGYVLQSNGTALIYDIIDGGEF